MTGDAVSRTVSDEVQIRHLRHEDLSGWWRLRSRAHPDASETDIRLATMDFRGDRRVAVVAEQRGRLIGLAEMTIAADPSSVDDLPVAFLTTWYVEEDHRRSGIGRDLLGVAETWAGDKGCVRVRSAAPAGVGGDALVATGFRAGAVYHGFAKTLQRNAAADMPSGSLRLVEIDEDNVRAVCDLRVAAHQRALVAPNAVSIAQASVTTDVWMRAAFLGDQPVGFVLLSDGHRREGATTPRYYLWRFMVDERYQGHGLGRRMMAEVEAYVAARPEGHTLYLSVVDAPGSAFDFYAALGYEPTGRVHALETEMCKPLV